MHDAAFGNREQGGDRRARRTNCSHDDCWCAAGGFVDDGIEGVRDAFDKRNARIRPDVHQTEIALFCAQRRPFVAVADERGDSSPRILNGAGFEQGEEGILFEHRFLGEPCLFRSRLGGSSVPSLDSFACVGLLAGSLPHVCRTWVAGPPARKAVFRDSPVGVLGSAFAPAGLAVGRRIDGAMAVARAGASLAKLPSS